MINSQFVLAGKAIFTVSNDKGEHFTYRVNAKDARSGNGKVYFASLLIGPRTSSSNDVRQPDNENSYSYMGLLLPERLRLKLTKGSKVGRDAKSVQVLSWALQMILKGSPLPDGYSIQHAGKCCRCARTLTEPDSIKYGIGPHCRQEMGI
jgi:hypothetical protein